MAAFGRENVIPSSISITMPVKRISIDAVRLGMYIIGVDRPWLETPFLKHWFVLNRPSQIEKLQQAGIQFVDIDTDRGLDVLSPVDDPPVPPANSPTPEFSNEMGAESRLAGLPETLQGHALSRELHEAREAHRQMLEDVKLVLDTVRQSGRISGSQVQACTEEMIAQTVGKEEVFGALIRTRDYSPDLYQHAVSVATLGVLVGRLLGMEATMLQHVTMAALLHDIGLLRLPPDLLRPMRTLSSTERAQYDEHPKESLAILEQSSDMPEEVLHIVAHHHFPFHQLMEMDNQKPWLFPARLVRVVDEYDDLLTGQGLRPSLSVKGALGELYRLGQCQELDPHIVAQLITQIGIYPLYSLVELNTGERGIITGIVPEKLLQPTVLLITQENGQPYEEPIPVNFSAPESSVEPLEIVKVLDAEREGIQIEEVLADWVAL